MIHGMRVPCDVWRLDLAPWLHETFENTEEVGTFVFRGHAAAACTLLHARCKLIVHGKLTCVRRGGIVVFRGHATAECILLHVRCKLMVHGKLAPHVLTCHAMHVLSIHVHVMYDV